ncbi:MAG: SURF1 family protein [Pseudohongiella sp.]|nr:SURF1 family protein [Pseudohongiella sp.]
MHEPTSKLSGRKFKFNWGMTLFTLALFPLLISFGFWQLEREQQKTQLQKQYDERALATPRNEAEIDWNNPDLGWTPVTAEGRFDSARQFMLDNRILDSKVGYEIITPFVTDSGTILINRGWVSQGSTRAEIPELGVSEATLTISGHIYVPDGDAFVLGSDSSSVQGWPKLIQKIDPEQMALSLGSTNVKPFVVRLTGNSQGVLQTNWAAISMRPETHRAYAVQWFTMAAVLLFLYIMFSFRKPEN